MYAPCVFNAQAVELNNRGIKFLLVGYTEKSIKCFRDALLCVKYSCHISTYGMMGTQGRGSLLLSSSPDIKTNFDIPIFEQCHTSSETECWPIGERVQFCNSLDVASSTFFSNDDSTVSSLQETRVIDSSNIQSSASASVATVADNEVEEGEVRMQIQQYHSHLKSCVQSPQSVGRHLNVRSVRIIVPLLKSNNADVESASAFEYNTDDDKNVADDCITTLYNRALYVSMPTKTVAVSGVPNESIMFAFEQDFLGCIILFNMALANHMKGIYKFDMLYQSKHVTMLLLALCNNSAHVTSLLCRREEMLNALSQLHRIVQELEGGQRCPKPILDFDEYKIFFMNALIYAREGEMILSLAPSA